MVAADSTSVDFTLLIVVLGMLAGMIWLFLIYIPPVIGAVFFGFVFLMSVFVIKMPYISTGVILFFLGNVARIFFDKGNTGFPLWARILAMILPAKVPRTSDGLVDSNELQKSYQDQDASGFLSPLYQLLNQKQTDALNEEARMLRSQTELHEKTFKANEEKIRAQAAGELMNNDERRQK